MADIREISIGSTVYDVKIKNDHALKSYLDDGTLLTDTEGLADVTSYAHSTFDSSKFTTTGTPTITDGGIASGLNTSNYVITNIKYSDIKDKSWVFKNRVYLGQTNISFILFDNNNRTLGSVLYNNGLKFCANFGDSSSSTGEIYVADLGILPVGWYDLSLSFDLTTGTYTNKAVSVSTNQEYSNTYTPTTDNKQLYSLNTKSGDTIFRISSGVSALSLECDLKQFSIRADGIELFNGNKTGTDTYTISSSTVSIPYTLSKTGSKIVDSYYRTQVTNVYNAFGYAPYYTLNEGTNFTLPMGEVYGLIAQNDIIEYVNGTSGYRIWVKTGYCEQWGVTLNITTTSSKISYLKNMNAKGVVASTYNGDASFTVTNYYMCINYSAYTDGFLIASNGAAAMWFAYGYLV